MSTATATNEEKFLKRFLIGRGLPKFKTAQEKKTFTDLQKHDLIRLEPTGKLKITSRGKYALGVGVRRYLANARLEKRLFREFSKGQSQNRWMLVFSVLAILLALAVLSWYLK